MSKFGLVVVLMLMAGAGRAQNYFVFIQADNNQPFYVRLGDQVYSSSAGGHLILSSLKDSTYSVVVGLPGQAALERRYTVAIHQKDLEFRLKDQGGMGWGLYDEQKKEMKTPETGGREAEPAPPGLKKDDAFSRLMAGVVQDTAVLYSTYAMAEPLADSAKGVKTDTMADAAVSKAGGTGSGSLASGTAVSGEAPPGGTGAGVTTGIGSDTLVKAPVIAPPVRDSSSGSGRTGDQARAILPAGDTAKGVIDSGAVKVVPGTAGRVNRPRGVVKLSERKLARSVRLSFADRSLGKKADTIVLFIPVDTPVVVRGNMKQGHGADSGRAAATRAHGPNPDSPLLGQVQNSVLPHPAVPVAEGPRSRPVDTPRKSSETKGALPFVNSDCHNYATDYDVDKLRVKLLEATKDEDRIIAARKVFKTRCFATRQIRALSEVFTSDGGKYRFFEAAYPFCSDSQFSELGALLADPVFSGKFRAMVQH
ncbi:MAG: hypothetical protein JST42_08765 [Bacteroidetes bacterium]|nr:hypothetical protein [Bacteroidota bacterium]